MMDRVWNAYRRAMKKAEKQDHAAVAKVWHEFEQYCDTNGWPDWWSDLERAYTDSLYQSVW